MLRHFNRRACATSTLISSSKHQAAPSLLMMTSSKRAHTRLNVTRAPPLEAADQSVPVTAQDFAKVAGVLLVGSVIVYCMPESDHP